MKKDDKVVICTDYADSSTIVNAVFIKSMDEFYSYVKVGATTKAVPKGSIYPEAAREELFNIVTQRQLLKKQLEDSMKLIYQFNNKINLIPKPIL